VQAGTPYRIWGRGNALHDYSGIHFTDDVRACGTCHEDDDDTPQASLWRTQPSIRGCGSCHDDVDFGTGFHHNGITATDADCSTCHGPNTTFGLRAEDVHFVPERRAAGQFQYEILEVTNTGPGETPRVRFRVLDPTRDGAAWNIHADAPFTSCAGGASRLAIDIAWPTQPDYTNTGSGLVPAQPIQLNPLTACGGASTAQGDGSFTVASTTAIPAGATGTATVALEGHPALDANGDGTLDRIPVRNVHAFAPITDAEPVPRRTVVDLQSCKDCHGVLTIHGNNRTDDIQVCATCHNPNATDAARRVAGSACVTELGTDDEPIDLKYMIHALHAGNTNVCGFGNSAIRFDEVVYPGKLANCEGCHVPDTYYPVDPTRVLATTVDVGINLATPADDRAITPNTAACSACHVDTQARAHMTLNGGSFNAAKQADGTLAGATIETCSLCHGPGRTADVARVHEVALFDQANAATDD
jgi:OmcA/MtrC family decaheme c-type cytochrome